MKLDIGNALICYEGEPSVELTSGNVKYLCHPNVAATILRDGYSSETSVNVSTLIPPDLLLLFMDFVYHGCIEFKDPSIPARLLKVLLQTDLTEAPEKICVWVQESKDCLVCLHVYDVLAFTDLEDSSRFHHTVEVAAVIICINYPTIFETPALLSLSKDGLTAVLSLDDLIIPCEDFIFRAVLQWVEHDETKRSQYLVELMEKVVRLPFVRLKTLKQALASKNAAKDPAFPTLIRNAKRDTTIERRKGILSRSHFVYAQEGFAFRGNLGCGGETFPYRHEINVPHALWRTRQRYCYHNGYVFALGGRDLRNGRRRSIERMDLLDKTWTLLSVRLWTRTQMATITQDSDTITISYQKIRYWVYPSDNFSISSLIG